MAGTFAGPVYHSPVMLQVGYRALMEASNACEGLSPDTSVLMFRTMSGICGDLVSRAEALEADSSRQAQHHGQQKLHSTLVAAYTGDRSQTSLQAM